jgi:hypothetical protein
MASLNEQMDDMLSNNYVDDTTAEMPSAYTKMQRKLDQADAEGGEVFKDKEDADERLQSTVTGMALGSAAIPSDTITMASEAANFVKKNPILSAGFPKTAFVAPYLEEVNKLAGRPGFEELIKALGIKSDPTNTSQIVGEILSPSFYFPAFKGAVKLSKAAGKAFDDLGDIFKGGNGTGGAKLVEEGPSASSVNKTPQIDDFNKPQIDMNTVGLKSAGGQEAFKTYSQKEAELMGIKGSNPAILGEKELIKYINLKDQDKYKLFKDTGMYRGADGKVRYKLDTRQATLQEGYLKDSGMLAEGETIIDATKIPENATLKDLINYEDLFKQYGTKDNPLLNIKIKFLESTKENVNTAMAYLPNPNPNKPATIYISNNTGFNGNAGMTTKEFRSFLLHEIQHAVQRKESFNVGGSAAKYLPVDHYKNVDVLNSEINKELSNVVQAINTRTNKAPIEINESVLNTFSEKLARQELEAQLKTSRTIKNVNLPDIDTNFTAAESELHSLINHLPAFDTFMKKRISLYGKQAINAKIEKEASRKYMELPGEVEAFWIQDADAAALKGDTSPKLADISTQVLKNRPLRTENKYTEFNAADNIKGEQ